MINLRENVGKRDLSAIVEDSASPKIVIFVADWCGYCRRFLALVKSSESDYEGTIYAVDADSEDESLWEDYEIPLVPTILVIKARRIVFRQNGRPMVGLVKGDLERAIASAASAK